jgi:acyl-CoA synthetase (NDP forming)
MRPVETILRAAQADGRTALFEHEVYGILAAAGIGTPRWVFWPAEQGVLHTGTIPRDIRAFLDETPAERLVLKIVSPQILHKSDVGGLAFCGREPSEILAAAGKIWDETRHRSPGADRRGLLLMERVPAASGTLAVETLLSVKQDPAFGTVLVVGLGGVLTEWFGRLSAGKSTVVMQPGSVRPALEQAVATLPAFSFLFRPSRQHAAPPLDLDQTVERIEALGALAARFGLASPDTPFTLDELEMNPMLLSADGRWIAVDGVGSFSETKSHVPRRPLEKITNLLRPRSVVVVGASSKGMNPGRIILRNLKVSDGVAYGHLYAVHPKEESIDGVPCVKALEALPEKVDLAVVAIPAEGARDSIRAIAARDLASSIILIPGGFAETGQSGLEREIIGALESSRANPGGGPVLVGGNCLGIVSKRQYNTFFLPHYKLPFHDAPGDDLVCISQSGAYLVTVSSNLDGIIFPRVSVSYGNQMDLTVSDFLEYYLDDDTARVLACYVEGFKPLDGERFVRLARELRARGRRVIAFKAGKTPLGAQAAQSHTASLAGDYAVARSLMQQAGVVVAETLNMFEDYVKIFTMLSDRIPTDGGRRVAIISNAGFECSTVLDRLYRLELAPLSPSTKQRLRGCLPEIAHADNPIDATPMATTKQFVAAAAAMIADHAVDAILVSPVPVTPALDNLAPDLIGTHRENMYAPGSLPQELVRLFHCTRKPVVVAVDSGRLYDDFVQLLQRNGIPVWRKIDRASRALSALMTG